MSLSQLPGMAIGALNSYIVGGSATLPSLEMFMGALLQDGYFPREWGENTHEQQGLIYCKTNIAGLFFDAILNVSTEHSATITQHPVQSGANISDHMYLEPVQITMEIGMSDAMASMVMGQWAGVGGSSKSVNAYQKLVELQAARIPFTVLDRLNTYNNMVIKSVSVNDDFRTKNGLRATVSMQQLIMANVTEEKVSAREWTSGSGVNRGETQPQEVPTSIAGQIEGDTVDGSQTGRETK